MSPALQQVEKLRKLQGAQVRLPHCKSHGPAHAPHVQLHSSLVEDLRHSRNLLRLLPLLTPTSKSYLAALPAIPES
eukprot:1797240-Amphidinium_carterae.1